MNNLNELEIAVLERVAQKYPSLRKHFPYLNVKNRQITGVGMYVNFNYTSSNPIEDIQLLNASLSTNENIIIDNLKYGLGYEIDITEGKINYIEFVTYGEEWDGTVKNFSFR